MKSYFTLLYRLCIWNRKPETSTKSISNVVFLTNTHTSKHLVSCHEACCLYNFSLLRSILVLAASVSVRFPGLKSGCPKFVLKYFLETCITREFLWSYAFLLWSNLATDKKTWFLSKTIYTNVATMRNPLEQLKDQQ